MLEPPKVVLKSYSERIYVTEKSRSWSGDVRLHGDFSEVIILFRLMYIKPLLKNWQGGDIYPKIGWVSFEDS